MTGSFRGRLQFLTFASHPFLFGRVYSSDFVSLADIPAPQPHQRHRRPSVLPITQFGTARQTLTVGMSAFVCRKQPSLLRGVLHSGDESPDPLLEPFFPDEAEEGVEAGGPDGDSVDGRSPLSTGEAVSSSTRLDASCVQYGLPNELRFAIERTNCMLIPPSPISITRPHDELPLAVGESPLRHSLLSATTPRGPSHAPYPPPTTQQETGPIWCL